MPWAIAATAVAVAALAGSARNAAAALPPGNTVAQWNKIAEDTVVGSGAFQAEGFIYTAYASTAVYNAVVAIEGGYDPLDSTITAPSGASVDCAVVEAAYQTLHYYFSAFPALIATLDADHAEALPRTSADAPPTAVQALRPVLRPRTRSSTTARPDRTRMGA